MRNRFLDPLGPFLADFYDRVNWGRAETDFVKANTLPMDAVNAHAGNLAILNCSFDSDHFILDDTGEVSAVFEVLAGDDATTIDLCAFPIDRAEVFGTALGAAPVLGEARIVNPATWFAGPLPVFRTPLRWLRAGCHGAVILDHRLAPYAIGQALGPLQAEDLAHARDLKAMLCTAPVDPHNILVPHAQRLRVAS